MIAFTNHALDHMLVSVLDAKITNRIVRLGSRSADERISGFSIEKLEEIAGRSSLAGVASSEYRELKKVEKQIKDFMIKCLRTNVDSERILEHLQIVQPEFYEDFLAPAPWIRELYESNVENNRGFVTVGRNGDSKTADESLYSFWLNGYDIEFLFQAHNPPPPKVYQPITTQNTVEQTTNRFSALSLNSDIKPDLNGTSSGEEDETDSSEDENEERDVEEVWQALPFDDEDSDEPQASADEHIQPLEPPHSSSSSSPALSESFDDFYISETDQFFARHGYSQIPIIPSLDSSVDILRLRDDVWGMSMSERRRIHAYWESEVRILDRENSIEEFERLRNRHAEAVRNNNESRAAVRKMFMSLT